MPTLFLFAIPGVMAQKLFPGLASPDMLYLAMILNLMTIGLLGIMIAVLFAALTSALSAIMNSTSTLFTLDGFRKETIELRSVKWYSHYRIWGTILLVLSAMLLIILS